MGADRDEIGLLIVRLCRQDNGRPPFGEDAARLAKSVGQPVEKRGHLRMDLALDPFLLGLHVFIARHREINERLERDMIGGDENDLGVGGKLGRGKKRRP